MMNILTKVADSDFVYRDKLSIPESVNFGIELELDKINPLDVYKLVNSNLDESWQIKMDDSLTKDESAEIVSPILKNTKETWILLKKVGDLLSTLNPSYDRCSFQVNFDGELLPKVEDRVRFLKLYAMYEDIIYRFSKGEKSSYRDSLENYASPIIWSLKGVLSLGNNSILEMFSNQKRYGITFKTRECDLIEFRSPNMSSNPIYFQNYINTFYYLVKCAASGKYDKKEVDQYIDHFSKTYILENYEMEKREKALKMCKTIFPQTIDSINFMHQYLGK